MYATLIAQVIGTDDPATLALVEDLMRDGRSGLDSLTPAQFAAEARQAYSDIDEMRAVGMLDGYCRAVCLAVPTAA